MILRHQKLEYRGLPLIEKIRIKAPYRHKALFQNEGCFLYVVGTSSIFRASNQNVTVEPSNSVLLNCGQYIVDFLKNVEDEETEVYAIHLYQDVLLSIYARDLPAFFKPKASEHYINKINSTEVVSNFINSIDFYFENPAALNDELMELKIKELILLLLQTKNASSIISLIESLFTPRTVALQEVIEKHLFSNLTIDQLAKLSNMSLSSFKRAFQKRYGTSSSNYFKEIKMDRATQLLKVSDKTISQIAFEVGYSDPAYFSRLFKKHYKKTPQKYRISA